MKKQDKSRKEISETIINLLNQNPDRSAAASICGYKNWRSMDVIMRRCGYHWNSKLKNYCLRENNHEEQEIHTSSTPSLVFDILSFYENHNNNMEKTFSNFNFKNENELSLYMLENGYIWDSSKKNYLPISTFPKLNNDMELEKIKRKYINSIESKKSSNSPTSDEDDLLLGKYLPLLHFLDKNKSLLEKLIGEK